MKAVPVLLLAAGFLPAVASAALTSSDTLISYNPAEPIATTSVLTLDTFDTVGGTRYLTAATLTLSYDVEDFDVSFTNNDSSVATTAKYNFSSDILRVFADNSLRTSEVSPLMSAANLLYTTEAQYVTLQPGETSAPTSYSGLNFSAARTLGNLNAFETSGAGEFTLSVQGDFGLLTNISSNTRINGGVKDATVTATIAYEYAVIPEPSTYALLFGALTLGLVGWRRFRK